MSRVLLIGLAPPGLGKVADGKNPLDAGSPSVISSFLLPRVTGRTVHGGGGRVPARRRHGRAVRRQLLRRALRQHIQKGWTAACTGNAHVLMATEDAGPSSAAA
jgi:hypothetical protein